MKPDEKGQQKDGKKEQQARKPEDAPGQTRNDRVAEGKLPESRVGALLQKLIGADQWGRLPRKLRENMGSATAREFPREYREIIARYYEKMAEVLTTK